MFHYNFMILDTKQSKNKVFSDQKFDIIKIVYLYIFKGVDNISRESFNIRSQDRVFSYFKLKTDKSMIKQ